MSDTLSDGRRFRVLCVVDDCTRECLRLVADTSLSGLRVARELDAIVAVRGLPSTVVSDNGTELTSTGILRWSQERGVDWHYSKHSVSTAGQRFLRGAVGFRVHFRASASTDFAS